nr:DUF6104 family protein [Actinocatenispora sera]
MTWPDSHNLTGPDGRGAELDELARRRGAEQVELAELAETLRDFVDANPEFEVPIDRLATWLARLDDEDDG